MIQQVDRSLRMVVLVLLGIGLLLSTGCPVDPGTQTGSLRIVHQGESHARTIEPDAQDIAIGSYRVTGTGPRETTFGPETYDASPIDIDGLFAGTWSFTVQGLNNDNPAKVVASLTQDVVIESKKTTDATFTLAYAEGTGDARITITWPASVASVHDLVVTIDTSIPGKESFVLNAADGTTTDAVVSILLSVDDLPTGSYDTWVTFRNAAQQTLGIPAYESLNIYSDQTSEGTIEFVEAMFPVETPVFSPAGGQYDTEQTVTITTTSPGATIHYTLDGSDPDTSSPVYTGALSVGETTTVKAFATRNFAIPSNIAQDTYTILYPSPRFSVAAGTHASPQELVISCAQSASLYYTVNGTTPTTTSPLYSTPLQITENTTVKAIAIHTGDNSSTVKSAAYKIMAASPVFSAEGDTYLAPQDIELTSATPEATIRYTANGDDPTSSSTLYTESIPVGENLTLKAIAYKANMESSDIITHTYHIRVGAPQCTPSAGIHASARDVALSSATSGAAIRYTLDGSTPTTSSTLYTESIPIAANKTLKAIAYKSGMDDSPVTEAVYQIQSAVPTFSVAAGTYAQSQSVELSTTTSGAEIRYTIDDSAPTTQSLLYSTAIAVDADTVVKAISVKEGMTASNAASATYRITGASGLTVVDPVNSSVAIQWPDAWKDKTVIPDAHGSISAAISPEPASGQFTYTWYLDGLEALNRNGDVASVTDTIEFGLHGTDVRPAQGPHILAVKAIAGTKTYSDSYFFMVYSNGTAGEIDILETGIELDESSLVLSEGETKQLTATVSPSNATEKDVVWTSSDSDLVEVSSSGLVTAHFGWDGTEVTITAETVNQTYSDTCTVTAPGVVDVLSYFSTTLFLKEDGSAWSTGSNVDGQLGDGTTTSRSTPAQVLTSVEAITSGNNHSVFLKTDGSVLAAGRNDRGQLGDGTNTSRSTPVKVLEDVAQVVGMAYQTFMIKDDGSLWATGENGWGQLGDGVGADLKTPKKIMEDVQAVYPGETHTLILKTDGSLYATGKNDYGQLGNGTNTGTSSPVLVMTDVSSAAVGNLYSMILKTDGTLWATGGNQYGQLGDGTTTAVNTPKQVMAGVSAVYANWGHTAILKTDGTLHTTGYNNAGQIGDNSTTSRLTPFQIASGVVEAAVGLQHTVYLTTDDTLYAAGANMYGRFGTGDMNNHKTPVAMMADVAAYCMAENQSLVIKEDGSIYGMGSNSKGQLGNGTTTNTSTPVKSY